MTGEGPWLYSADSSGRLILEGAHEGHSGLPNRAAERQHQETVRNEDPRLKRNSFVTALEQSLWTVARVLEHHPRQVTALVAAMMFGGGGAAFAVASFGPDAAN